MKIAVTFENGNIFGHFGHTESFKFYEIENGKIVKEEIKETNGSGHGALAGILASNKVNVLICGGIGRGAINCLEEANIEVCGGVSGNADEAVKAYLDGTLKYSKEANCNHHHEENHEHNCSGNCNHGSCKGN